MLNSEIKAIQSVINDSSSIIIATHTNPDGDALSSVMSMYWYIYETKNGKTLPDLLIPYIQDDLKPICDGAAILSAPSRKEYDLLIVVDCSDSTRVRPVDYAEIATYKNVLVIDHHEKSKKMVKSKYHYIDETASSCTCVIYKLFADYVLNPYFFEKIVTGLYSDTANLTLNVTPNCTKIIFDCENHGADMHKVKSTLNTVSERTEELIDIVLNRLIISTDGIAKTYLMQSDFITADEKNLLFNDKAIVECLLNLRKVKALIFLKENNQNQIKGSVRLRMGDFIDFDQMCKKNTEKNIFVYGGGHPKSAGFLILVKKDFKSTLKYTYRLISNEIRKQKIVGYFKKVKKHVEKNLKSKK